MNRFQPESVQVFGLPLNTGSDDLYQENPLDQIGEDNVKINEEKSVSRLDLLNPSGPARTSPGGRLFYG